MTHFSKFDQALEGCRNVISKADHVSDQPQRLATQHCAAAAAAALMGGQRFYLPEAAHVLEKRPLDESIKSIMRLPYEVACVLTETHITTEQGVVLPTWEITIGFEVDSGFNRTLKLFDPRTTPGRGFGVLCILKTTDGYGWAPLPIIGFCHLPEDRPGIQLMLGKNALTSMLVEHDGFSANEFQDNFAAIANLCAMLSLKNITVADRSPPPKVNKKRRAAGKTELYSYKVLVVDGEAWDSSVSSGPSQNNGVRSHLRRGHIRQISDGRHVWVRATYVHGNRPGFVDKDYAISGEIAGQ